MTARTSPGIAALALLLAVTVACSGDGGEPEASPALVVAGYFAPWDPRGRAALDRPPTELEELSPVWYQPTDAGALTFTGQQARADARRHAAEPLGRGARLVPSVSNFRDGRWDGDLVAGILDDPGTCRRHIEALVDAALQPGVGGVDLDYESLDAGHRRAYSSFVRDLGEALHREGRTLTVTVHAKTSEPGGWSGARAQDWAALGEVADQVRIMAYDRHWRDSEPGPVAPLKWVDDVVRFARGEVPADKIVLGVATYGYDWAAGRPGDDLVWEDATALAESRGVASRWDDESASPWFSYTDQEGRRHEVWYEDAGSLEVKVELARRYGLGGVVIWRVGGEDPAIWEVLGEAT